MARSLAGLSAVVACAVALPIACFFPDYTFNEGGGDGGSGASNPTAGGGSPGPGGASTMSTTSSSSNGGGGAGAEGGGGSGAEGGVGAQGGGGAGAQGGGGMGGAPVGGGGMGGMGGMPCVPSAENCTNGMDEDCDGDIDCADSDCTTVTCVDTVPVGWTGHYSLYDGQIAGAPGCGGAYPNQFYLGNGTPSAPPATCSACTCGNPTNQVCSPPPTINTQDATCAGGATCIGPLSMGPADGSCLAPDGYLGDNTCGLNCAGSTACNQSVTSVGFASVFGGSCNASPQVPNVPPATWGKLGRACSASANMAGGCGGGQKCVSDTAAPFESNVCISKVGVNACPAGGFTEQHIFYAGFGNDTRTCTNCACGAPSGGTCAVTISVYSNPTCTGSPVTTFDDGGCGNLVGNPDVFGRKAVIKTPVNGGSCTSSGGMPAGSCPPASPVTFCCIP